MRPYFQDESCTIYHGDCREILTSLPCADLVLTDPPYNCANIGPDELVYEGQRMKLPDDEYAEFCRDWFSAVRSALTAVFTPGISNTHNYPQPKWQICWHKPAAVSFNRMGGFNAWEPIFIYGDTAHVRLGQDYLLFNTMNFSAGPEADHPCPKALPLWQHLFGKFSKPEGLTIDPFMGSGTTLVAARMYGRRAIGVEICETYCEIAAKRLSQQVFDFEPKKTVDTGAQGILLP
jgi:DNA modification methylase